MLESDSAATFRPRKGAKAMNKQKLSQMQYKRVRVRPVARRIDSDGVDLPQIDDVWLVTQSSGGELNLLNPRSSQNVPLGMDHVREYMTDSSGRSDGFLKLKSQIFLFAPRGASVEPLPEDLGRPRPSQVAGRGLSGN